MTIENRSSTRFPVQLSVSIDCDGDTSHHSIINIALGGALLSFSRRLDLGQRIALTFFLPGEEEAIVVMATVRWASENNAGVQFDGLRAKEVWRFNEFLKQQES